MVAGIRVEGVEGYVALSRALRSVSPSARKMMRREINEAAKPLVPALRSAVMGIESSAQGSSNVARAAKRAGAGRGEVTSAKAARALRGSGLRQSVARSIRVVQKDNGFADQVGVFVKSEPSRSLPRDQRRLPRAMDRGSVRHPVFGRWIEGLPPQTFTPAGWFTRTAETHAPMVRARLRRILTEYQRDLAAALRRAA